MVLLDYLKKCDFDARLERYFDQSMQFESFEIGILKDDYFKTVDVDWEVFFIDADDDDADYQIDIITTNKYHQAKKDADITESANRMLRILYGFKMSIYYQDDLLMIDRFEDDFFNALDNYNQKNYNPLLFDDWDALDYSDLLDLNYQLESRICKESANRLYKSNPNIDVFDVLTICNRFIAEFEPDFDLIDFISRINSNSFADLIDSLNDWLQYFIFCDSDANPSNEDYRCQIIIGCVLNG
ncbi:MAG: hypothetical protein J6Y78_04255 [Paludibacteraceae bacterium]|nr:hypothetical protein [Paludibacteraceae bacterium]